MTSHQRYQLRGKLPNTPELCRDASTEHQQVGKPWSSRVAQLLDENLPWRFREHPTIARRKKGPFGYRNPNDDHQIKPCWTLPQGSEETSRRRESTCASGHSRAETFRNEEMWIQISSKASVEKTLSKQLTTRGSTRHHFIKFFDAPASTVSPLAVDGAHCCSTASSEPLQIWVSSADVARQLFKKCTNGEPNLQNWTVQPPTTHYQPSALALQRHPSYENWSSPNLTAGSKSETRCRKLWDPHWKEHVTDTTERWPSRRQRTRRNN